jgi:hypothetical protein
MAKTDAELRDAALIDLTDTEKRRLRALLASDIEKLRRSPDWKRKTKGKYTTTGTGIQPNVKITPGTVNLPLGVTGQEQIDNLQRRISQIEQSIKPAGPIDRITAPPSTDPNMAKGGGQYRLQDGMNETSGLVFYTEPGLGSDDIKLASESGSGFLIAPSKKRRGTSEVGEIVQPKKGVVGFETGIISVEEWNQENYNAFSQDPQLTIDTKRKLVQLKLLPPSTVIDGTPDVAFRQAMQILGARISTENFRRLQANPRQKLFDTDTGIEYLLSRGDAGDKTTSTVTSISTKDEAYATLNEALRAYLGREATQDELTQFTAQLNSFERANPLVATTTGTGDTLRTGGTEGAMGRMATEFARSQEGSAAFRGGTYYYDALLDALDNPLF